MRTSLAYAQLPMCYDCEQRRAVGESYEWGELWMCLPCLLANARWEIRNTYIEVDGELEIDEFYWIFGGVPQPQHPVIVHREPTS